MDYRIEEKDAFKVVGLSKIIKYDKAYEEVPKLWQSFFSKNELHHICSKYGINIDFKSGNNEFEYMICDDYHEDLELSSDFIIKDIPKLTWAIFKCVGSANKSVAKISKEIFNEWLPNSGYEISLGYNIEVYSDPSNYKNGINDDEYYCEIWIPVKKK